MYNQKLKYHYKPQKGWLNDPNGLVYFNGYYHVFYQHSPNFETPRKEPMHWGHARTKNFLDWEELPIALYPDKPYDCEGCWSGTAIVKDDVLYVFYSSIYTPDGEKEFKQTVSVAYSSDGVNFTKYKNNPIIEDYPPDGCPEFRDPAVTCIDGVYYCVMASGNKEKNTANLLLYKSMDLFNWEYQGIMCEWENGICAECPSFIPYGDEFLLTASVCHPGCHHFSVMFGDFQDGKFNIKQSAEVDKGPDQYAGQVFLDHKGRAIIISWLFGWEYAEYASRDIGCMSVPKQILKDGDNIYCMPVEEVRHLLKSNDSSIVFNENGFVVERTNREPFVYNGETKNIRCIRDGYVIEIFLNDGETVYTILL